MLLMHLANLLLSTFQVSDVLCGLCGCYPVLSVWTDIFIFGNLTEDSEWAWTWNMVFEIISMDNLWHGWFLLMNYLTGFESYGDDSFIFYPAVKNDHQENHQV